MQEIRHFFQSLFSLTLDFRVRLFNILALGGTVISLIMAFLSLGTGSWGNVLINIVLVAVSGGLFLYSYYSGKYQRCYLITIVMIFLIVFPVMFFTSGGYHGGMPAFFVFAIIFTVLMLALSSKVPVWMQVDPAIQDLAAQYFFILYTPMLARAAITIFGTLLRSAGDAKTPMRVGFLVNGVNVVLNFLLIYPTRQVWGMTVFGAGWGVIGAAVASAISFVIGGVCITVVLWRHPLLSPKGQKLRPDWDVLKPCLRVALPNALQRFGTSLGYVAFASMINSLGEIATAAHTIANTVESAFYIPGYGMQTAAATLAGNALGAGDNRRVKELGRMILFIEVSLMIVSGSLLFLFAPNMMRLFSRDAQVIALGVTVLRMVAVSEPFYGVSIIVEGMMQGMGNTMMPFVCSIAGMWGVRIVGTFICTQLLGMGLVSAWACMIAHNLLLFLLFAGYYISGKWNPMNRKNAVQSVKTAD